MSLAYHAKPGKAHGSPYTAVDILSASPDNDGDDDSEGNDGDVTAKEGDNMGFGGLLY